MNYDNARLCVTFRCDRKINLIKMFRRLFSIGLVEAKNMVEQGIVVSPEQLTFFLRRVDLAWKNEMNQADAPCALVMEACLYDPPPAQPVPFQGFGEG